MSQHDSPNIPTPKFHTASPQPRPAADHQWHLGLASTDIVLSDLTSELQQQPLGSLGTLLLSLSQENISLAAHPSFVLPYSTSRFH